MTIAFHGLMCDHGIDINTRCLDCELASELALGAFDEQEPADNQLCYWSERSELFARNG